MTNKQAVALVSRFFCVWFVYSAVLDLTAAPNLLAFIRLSSLPPSDLRNIFSQFERTLWMSSLSSALHLLVNIAAAIFFYRCRPWLIRFLTGDDAQEKSLSTTI
jgi:hypothetical protein